MWCLMSDLDSAVPAYSSDGLAVRDLFFVGSSGVHFFVEDEGQENLYSLLMRRCFPQLSSIEIFPQGGKSAVIKHATSGYRGFPNIRRIYLLDRDFDDLLGDIREVEGLFYFDQYCVENLVFDGQALLEVCIQESPRENRASLKDRLGFAESLECWIPSLDRLHRAFLLAQKFELGIKNTSSPLEDYVCGELRSVLNSLSIEAYVDRVYGAMVALGVVKDKVEFSEMLSDAFPEVSAKYINGKYLFGLSYRHMKRARLVKNVSADSLIYRSAQLCNLESFEGFINEVSAYLSMERRSLERQDEARFA